MKGWRFILFLLIFFIILATSSWLYENIKGFFKKNTILATLICVFYLCIFSLTILSLYIQEITKQAITDGNKIVNRFLEVDYNNYLVSIQLNTDKEIIGEVIIKNNNYLALFTKNRKAILIPVEKINFVSQLKKHHVQHIASKADTEI